MTPLILIPARMASTRLPNKPMADICGLPMIVQVWRRAMEAEAGPVWVACDDPAIEAVIRAAGGRAVLTDPALPSGSDRIHAALARVDPEGRHDVIVNVQGDMPTIPPSVIHAVLSPLAEPSVDIATLAALIHDFKDREDPAVVKPALALAEDGQSARALYFSRSPIPHGDGPLYHHIGIYAYRRHALERFVNLPPSPLEMREKLEQLRALEAGMVIGVALVDEAPVGVDTPAHLETARTLLTDR